MQIDERLEGVDIKRKRLKLSKVMSNKTYLLFCI